MYIKTKKIDIKVKKSATIHITPVADIHEDAKTCDRKSLNRMLQSRNNLENSYFLGLGDFGEFIMPGDQRHSNGSSVWLPKEPPTDAALDQIVGYQYKKYKKYKWLGFVAGNHELKIAKKNFTNPTKRLAELIGDDLYFGYCGRIFLRIWDHTKKGSPRGFIRILFHHGAWGGQGDGGYAGAMRWASGYPGWDLLLYGHNHQTKGTAFGKNELTTRGAELRTSSIVVSCGTHFAQNAADFVPYSQQCGYPPIKIGSPLIKITLNHTTGRYESALEIS